jgi:TM2 domain-containing membrane protein YozV
MPKKRKKVQTKREKTSNKGNVNWVVTLIMSIFFGWFGVDRFIMGHIGLGILKLVTLGGCGIWWMVDVILIATKHQYKNVKWSED